MGEICFHEATDDQLAAMYATQCAPETMLTWPEELDARQPESVFPFLASTTFDGVVEIASGGLMNYLVFRDGAVQRGFLADGTTPTPRSTRRPGAAPLLERPAPRDA